MKCVFNIIEVLYLGTLIIKDGVKIDPAKMAVIKEWPELLNVHDVKCFLGFVNFYKKFIKSFLKIA